MKHAKRISCLICIIAICFTLISAPAHAVGGLVPQSFGAWIAAGLTSLNIIGQMLAPAPGPVDPYYQWLSSPGSSTQEQYEYPVGRGIIQDYLNAATIKVDQGVTTIDGVVYDELWVSPGTFTNGLKTNLFDFKTKWAILSGNSGTLATGTGWVGNNPIYSVNGQNVSQILSYDIIYEGTYDLFNVFNSVCSAVQPGSNWRNITIFDKSGNVIKDYPSIASTYETSKSYNRIIIDHTTPVLQQGFNNWGTSTWNWIHESSPYLTYTPGNFQFDYVSGIVPAQESEIPDNYGLSIQIPHEQLQNFYNTYPQYNVDNSVINIQQDSIDIDQLTQAIFDQITSMEQIKSEWKEEEEPVPPEPEPPAPVDDVIEGLNVIANQQFEQMQQQTQIKQQQQQMQQQQLQQQQQINQNTQSIKDSIEQITETPTSEDLPDFKFDLRDLFPFCIPFDIYRLLSSFDAEPEAPHVQLPIVIDSINFSYTLDLDFSAWDPVAQAMRTAELIVYAIALAWATGKVIKW